MDRIGRNNLKRSHKIVYIFIAETITGDPQNSPYDVSTFIFEKIPHMQNTITSSFSKFNGLQGLPVEVFDSAIGIPNFLFEKQSFVSTPEMASKLVKKRKENLAGKKNTIFDLIFSFSTSMDRRKYQLMLNSI